LSNGLEFNHLQGLTAYRAGEALENRFAQGVGQYGFEAFAIFSITVCELVRMVPDAGQKLALSRAKKVFVLSEILGEVVEYIVQSHGALIPSDAAMLKSIGESSGRLAD
jgi:hypothetical protein